MRSRQLVVDGMGRLGGASSEHSGRVHSTAEERVPPATCPGPQENKTTRMEQVAQAVSLFGARVPKTVERTRRFPMCDV